MDGFAADTDLRFDIRTIEARFIDPTGEAVNHRIEVRTHPVTGRTCRVTRSRAAEREAGTESLPAPPPEALDRSRCPFCRPGLWRRTPRMLPGLAADGRLRCGTSILFPNLFPYGSFSAVSLFDDRHFVEIGSASEDSYRDSFINAARYLQRVRATSPPAVYTAITQNHLPSAGGSLVHPHLQINADRLPANHLRFLARRCRDYFSTRKRLLFSDYLEREIQHENRYIGTTGDWHWLAAFAPEGFFEIWGLLPQQCSLQAVDAEQWADLARGVLNAQRLFRSLNRNGYNLGLLAIEAPASRLELRTVLMVRSNYAPWVRNDHTGFEVMLGDMATFTAPEETARRAREFWPTSVPL